MATDIIAFLMTWVLLFHSLSQYTVRERLLLCACPRDARALIATQGALLNGKLLFLLRWLDWIFLGGYLPSLSINYVAMNKVMEKKLP